ncbi:extensin family protein [Bradyrhizobium lablabi]|uniref:extensin-like domain-containing protein n=1 Tax=Bradyrhizobium lablabi TaxID=722472 RepID=UPI001BA569DA|nr:extensin family protein [Bradyrhizobium lablabi]MBR0697170.1 extensin family protein [Bradyrhizobium lablabi]
MARGVRLYLVGSLVLVSLAGCGRGLFQTAEREPWRAEAEAACLKSGAVKEGPELVRVEPISGPGVCGAEFPLKVAAIGEGNEIYGFADTDLRPPAPIGNQPRWPINQQPNPPPAQAPYSGQAAGQQSYGARPNGPISLAPPGVATQEDEIDLPADGVPGPKDGSSYYPGLPGTSPRDRAAAPYSPAPYSQPQQPGAAPLPRLGPSNGNPVMTVGPVAVKPTATLACPIVSALERWLADSVQPAAQRWFGARVVEIRQISAYSCRGMNGNPHAHISEHAFGNALDIAAFTLADGRRITVKQGWRGMPEEQGFLRDIQGAACQQFNTVLAPGSNVYHYDHIHVDLMRRASRRVICQPAAVSGEEVAGRASARNPYASREPYVTGSLGGGRPSGPRRKAGVDEEDEFEDE